MPETHDKVPPKIRELLSKYRLPAELYRFDKTKEFGDSILSGSVWVSTLEYCRATEDQVRRDADDGKMVYNSGRVVGNSDDQYVRKILSRLPIKIEGSVEEVDLSNNTLKTTMRDAFLYCTTMRHDPKAMREFGESCIRIIHPTEFFYQLTTALLREGSRNSAEKRVTFNVVDAKEITYAERSYVGGDDAPGSVGFVKPADKYAKEQEFRMLWYPLAWPLPIKPHLLENAIDPELVERIQ